MATFSGTWYVNTTGNPDPGTGVIYMVDQADHNLVRAIITADWSTIVQSGYDKATISISVQRSECSGDLGEMPAAFAGLGIPMRSGNIIMPLLDMDIEASFLDPTTATPVTIPSNLTIRYFCPALLSKLVCFYEHRDFQGAKWCYRSSKTSLSTKQDNEYGSVKVYGPYAVEVFYGSNYEGKSTLITRSVKNMPHFNDHISSFRIVPQDNCNFTMVFASDPQITYKDTSDGEKYKKNRDHAKSIKKVMDATDPARFRGIVMSGDLTNYGHEEQLDVFKEIYQDKFFGVHRWLGLGNHDYENDVRFGWDIGLVDDFPGCYLNNCPIRMVDYFINQVRRLPKENFDYHKIDNYRLRGSLAYSWNIGQYHFVQINNYATYRIKLEDSVLAFCGKKYKIRSSLLRLPFIDFDSSWLSLDLRGAMLRGKTVIMNMHSGETNAKLVDVMSNFTNIAAIFVGHYTNGDKGHLAKERAEVPLNNGLMVPVFQCGGAENNEYLKVDFYPGGIDVYKVDSSGGDDSETFLRSVDL